jgi:hypothetical protein
MTTATLGPEREHLYRASPREPEIIRVPEIGFVMIDGHGDPNTSAEYADAIQALYSLSYTLKFALRKELGLLYRVAPLEGLWWADNIAEFSQERKGDWSWTMMIAQPEDVTPERFEGARGDAGRKKDLPALPKTRLERFEEGPAAQILYIGPYSDEGPTIARLHAFIREHAYSFEGSRQKHHEIYLSDPRRSAPERWRTIIRQPFTEA